MDQLKIKREWSTLLSDSGISQSQQSDELYNELIIAYSEAQRHYHTLDHILEMLSLLNESGCVEPAARWATWYHDIVYLPGHKNNEEKSALKAVSSLKSIGINNDIAQLVQNIILATQSHISSSDSSHFLLTVLDADMAILGSNQNSYMKYCHAISMEFGHIPRLAYEHGRGRFIRSVASQERIYQTAWFYDRFEKLARENIQQELIKIDG